MASEGVKPGKVRLRDVPQRPGKRLVGLLDIFVVPISAQGFTIDNPSASGTCACGDSFY